MSDLFIGLLPFHALSDYELLNEINQSTFDHLSINSDLKKLLVDSLSDEIVTNFEFKYYTPIQLDNLASKYKRDTKLSLFHVNIRSLNANYDKLVSFLQCCSFHFDVIVLSEIWATDIMYYRNLLDNYIFFYELPQHSHVGGVGMFVRKELSPIVRDDIRPTTNSNQNLFENIWIEICINKAKFFIGGFYRHPNTSVNDFRMSLTSSLTKIKNKKRCFLLGDFNLNILGYNKDVNTTEYLDEMILNGFLPLTYLPTRVTSRSATIIDHIYANFHFNESSPCKTGLICNDISDHF